MNIKTVGYWASTGLVSIAMFGSAIAYLTGLMDEGMAELGYPIYFVYILGSWKALVAPALLYPGIRKLKEWAYAGLFFTFTGAAISHVAVGDSIGHILPSLVFLVLTLASYALMEDVRFSERTSGVGELAEAG